MSVVFASHFKRVVGIFFYFLIAVFAILGSPAQAQTDARCYAGTSIFTLGQAGWTGCDGMYIASGSDLNAAVTAGTFQIEFPASSGTFYTFGDSALNVFTGQVTDMSRLFQGTAFNGDIGYWDTSNVTTMERMFSSASAFNQDIGSWDVSNVLTMQTMFRLSGSFNRDINNWNVSSVQNMREMFRQAAAFKRNLDNWDATSVTSMYRMFYQNSVFTASLDGWTISGGTDVTQMFRWGSSNPQIGGWNISGAVSMGRMFFENTGFNRDISGWNVSGVTEMENMFGFATALTKTSEIGA
ncbi:MAG: BspA family leucine-rich repeat surface protein [Pseudomonadota bacterium]